MGCYKHKPLHLSANNLIEPEAALAASFTSMVLCSTWILSSRLRINWYTISTYTTLIIVEYTGV